MMQAEKLTPEVLYNGIGYIKEEIPNLDNVLNADPNPEWLEKETVNEGGKNKDVYNLSIEKAEFILNRLYKDVVIEVKDAKVTEGISIVSVRVHYTNRDNVRMFQDGIASTSASGSNLRAMFPALKSVAIKDSLHHLGRIFGRDLNRKNTIKNKKPTVIDFDAVLKLFKQKESLLSPSDLEAANRIIVEKEVNSYKKLYESLKKL